jgi:signal transduction histidine kinase
VYIIGRFQKNAAISTQTYAELIRAELFDKIDLQEKKALENYIENFDIPIIITDPYGNPIMWRNIFRGNIFNRHEIARDDFQPETMKFLKQKIARLTKKYEPKIIYGKDGKSTRAYLVFGSSSLISGLGWMPFGEGIFILLFSAFVYFALHNVMITERSNLWVGLAKETAHQLGTPISSLMGWVEYMKTIRDADDEIDPEIFINQIQDICKDMQKDLTRLQKITSRFSQIGSKPALKINNINEIIEENMKYFRTRLPLLGKRIEIRNYPCSKPNVPLNRDLMEWVLENLFKNAIDAIKKSEGIIEIKTEYIEYDNILRIQHIDNGRGISWDDHKNVFTPGFTTKTRGWGLGLTLAKRIVEDYHHGRIYVSWSQRNKGTAINIDLPVNRAVI